MNYINPDFSKMDTITGIRFAMWWYAADKYFQESNLLHSYRMCSILWCYKVNVIPNNIALKHMNIIQELGLRIYTAKNAEYPTEDKFLYYRWALTQQRIIWMSKNRPKLP